MRFNVNASLFVLLLVTRRAFSVEPKRAIEKETQRASDSKKHYVKQTRLTSEAINTTYLCTAEQQWAKSSIVLCIALEKQIRCYGEQQNRSWEPIGDHSP